MGLQWIERRRESAAEATTNNHSSTAAATSARGGGSVPSSMAAASLAPGKAASTALPEYSPTAQSKSQRSDPPIRDALFDLGGRGGEGTEARNSRVQGVKLRLNLKFDEWIELRGETTSMEMKDYTLREVVNRSKVSI